MLNWPAVKDSSSPTGLDKTSKFETKLMTMFIIMTFLSRMGRFYHCFINHVCNLMKCGHKIGSVTACVLIFVVTCSDMHVTSSPLYFAYLRDFI